VAKRKDHNDAVVIGVEEGGLYKLKGKSDATLTHSTINSCELWHRRLAHVSYKALPMVSKVVIGLSDIQVNRDRVCTREEREESISKQQKQGQRNLRHHSLKCLWTNVSHLSMQVCYLSFIDDYSRKTWIYFLRSKDEVFKKLKEFKVIIENQTKRKIKILRSDNGGEFT